MLKKCSLLLLSVYAFADCSAPSEHVEQLVRGVKTELRETCQHSADISAVKSVIRTKFMPHVDSSVMTKQVLGRKYWFESSEADREKLQGLLEVLLIKQYAESFSCEYLDNRMEFLPIRGEVKQKVRVETNVYLAGEDPIQVKYLMRCDEDQWKIFDIVVDGLSVAQTYRSQFNSLLSQGGIKRLNAYLESKLGAS